MTPEEREREKARVEWMAAFDQVADDVAGVELLAGAVLWIRTPHTDGSDRQQAAERLQKQLLHAWNDAFARPAAVLVSTAGTDLSLLEVVPADEIEQSLNRTVEFDSTADVARALADEYIFLRRDL